MSTPSQIISKIKTILSEDSTLKNYVLGGVMLGDRTDIIDFPCIVVDYGGELEEDVTYPTQRITMTVFLMCFFKNYDKDTMLVGNEKDKGTLEFKNDILKAIDSDRNLSGLAEWVRTTNTTVIKDAELFPIQSFVIELQVNFRQTSGVRT